MPKMFLSYVRHCHYLFPTRGSKPQVASRHHGIAIMLLGLRLPQMPRRCYNTEQLSVGQINGKTYWTGTIMQTNETRTNFALKNQPLPVGSMTEVTELTPLRPSSVPGSQRNSSPSEGHQPPAGRDCRLCLSLGAPQYLATAVP